MTATPVPYLPWRAVGSFVRSHAPLFVALIAFSARAVGWEQSAPYLAALVSTLAYGPLLVFATVAAIEAAPGTETVDATRARALGRWVGVEVIVAGLLTLAYVAVTERIPAADGADEFSIDDASYYLAYLLYLAPALCVGTACGTAAVAAGLGDPSDVRTVGRLLPRTFAPILSRLVVQTLVGFVAIALLGYASVALAEPAMNAGLSLPAGGEAIIYGPYLLYTFGAAAIGVAMTVASCVTIVQVHLDRTRAAIDPRDFD